MSLFRREPLHVRLAREGGLGAQRPPPHDPRPRLGVPGIHGGSRPREWDAVIAAEAPSLGVDEVDFAALPDGRLVVAGGANIGADSLEPLAAALDAVVPRPYRASAVWRGGDRWAVAGRRIEIAELPPSVLGDEIVLSVADGERSLLVDGLPSFGSLPALERLGASRSSSFVIRAERLAATLFEIDVSPL
jgi:hypothetical protein